jgi:hypothetical protein
MPPIQSAQLLSASDLRAILSDALLSFSPLATLVGMASACALAHRVTNLKQTIVVSLAPVGALGMMAVACKGANLPGLKDMLGVGEEDINDAARTLGCGTARGEVVPRMDKHGGLTSTLRHSDPDDMASAIVRLRWETGKHINFLALQDVVHTFAAATMSGRVMWEVDASESVFRERVQKVKLTLMAAWSGPLEAFEETNGSPGGEGMIELHWPAPAMTLETNPIVIYLYGAFFGLGFLCIAIFAAIRPLSWQSPLSSILLVGGQTLLIFGHVATQYLVKYKRETLEVRIPPNNVEPHWMLIDKTKFTSSLARRPHSFTTSPRGHIILRQYHRLQGNFVVAWQALLTMLLLTTGFIAFYVGGKSSDVKTVLIYIGLFIGANILKGPVVSIANKPTYTLLNNFGHEDVVVQSDGEEARKVDAVLVQENRAPRPESGQPTSEPPPDGTGDRQWCCLSVLPRWLAAISFRYPAAVPQNDSQESKEADPMQEKDKTGKHISKLPLNDLSRMFKTLSLLQTVVLIITVKSQRRQICCGRRTKLVGRHQTYSQQGLTHCGRCSRL